MFHVLPMGVPRLISWPETAATKILCDVKTPREAIPLKKFIALFEQKKLNTQRCCKACFRKASAFTRQT